LGEGGAEEGEERKTKTKQKKEVGK